MVIFCFDLTMAVIAHRTVVGGFLVPIATYLMALTRGK